MKHYFMLFAMLMTTMLSFAQTLYVNDNTGKSSYSTSDIRLISVNETNLDVFFIDGNSTTHEMSDMKYLSFKDSETPTSLDNFQEDDGSIELYPIPVQDQLNIRFQSTTFGKLKIEIIDLDTKIQIEMQTEIEKGDNQIIMNLSGLHAGVYICKTTYGFKSHAKKFIKK